MTLPVRKTFHQEDMWFGKEERFSRLHFALHQPMSNKFQHEMVSFVCSSVTRSDCSIRMNLFIRKDHRQRRRADLLSLRTVQKSNERSVNWSRPWRWLTFAVIIHLHSSAANNPTKGKSLGETYKAEENDQQRRRSRQFDNIIQGVHYPRIEKYLSHVSICLAFWHQWWW